MDGKEIIYPMPDAKQSGTAVPQSRNKDKNTPRKRPSWMDDPTWFYRVTEAVSRGRQPLYFPVRVVKNWVLYYFKKILLTNEEGNRLMAKIIRQSKRNKNEFYVGKEWGELVTKNGFEADDLLNIDIIERDDDNRVAVLQVKKHKLDIIIHSDDDKECLISSNDWLLPLSKSAASGTQPLYIPVAVVKDWLINLFNKVVFIDNQGNRIMAYIKAKYKRNKHEYYVGKE
ncbi:hypothetical protein Fmac_001797 [Flemingia macrophylla]|uniref:TF-B3 domain-containing protein n=1 Tax=Flemingia macrophylla TaxID=520843 RepID=A0ABD1NI39_9FABA